MHFPNQVKTLRTTITWSRLHLLRRNPKLHNYTKSETMKINLIILSPQRKNFLISTEILAIQKLARCFSRDIMTASHLLKRNHSLLMFLKSQMSNQQHHIQHISKFKHKEILKIPQTWWENSWVLRSSTLN